MSNQKEKNRAVTRYLRSDTSVALFKEIFGGGNPNPYIANVVLAVRASKALQETRPESILTSALRLATLQLSVDAAQGHAYLVPIKGSCEAWIGYKGYQELARRTNKYRYINATPVWEGMEVVEDYGTGEVQLTGSPKNKLDKSSIYGYYAAFQMLNGYEKQIFWTKEEIEAHGKEYAPSYSNPKGRWQKDFVSMALKTVIKQLLTKWGSLDPAAVAMLNELDGTDMPEDGGAAIDFEVPEYIEADFMEPTAAEKEERAKSTEQHISDLYAEGDAPPQIEAPSIDDFDIRALLARIEGGSGVETTEIVAALRNLGGDFTKIEEDTDFQKAFHYYCTRIGMDVPTRKALFVDCENDHGAALQIVFKQYERGYLDG